MRLPLHIKSNPTLDGHPLRDSSLFLEQQKIIPILLGHPFKDVRLLLSQ